MKKAKTAKPETKPSGKPTPWPMLSEYRYGTGIFRARPITWSPLLHFAANPYSMGVTAVYCVKVNNFLGMVSGGMVNPSLDFVPPVALRNAFLEAYNIANQPGKFLSWANVENLTEGLHEWVECDLKSFSKPRRLDKFSNKGLDAWEEWFQNNREAFSNIHRMLTDEGVGEFGRVTYSLDTAINMTPAEISIAGAAIVERERSGLAL